MFMYVLHFIFTYLESMLSEDGELDAEITHRLQSGGRTGSGYMGCCAIDTRGT